LLEGIPSKGSEALAEPLRPIAQLSVVAPDHERRSHRRCQQYRRSLPISYPAGTLRLGGLASHQGARGPRIRSHSHHLTLLKRSTMRSLMNGLPPAFLHAKTICPMRFVTAGNASLALSSHWGIRRENASVLRSGGGRALQTR